MMTTTPAEKLEQVAGVMDSESYMLTPAAIRALATTLCEIAEQVRGLPRERIVGTEIATARELARLRAALREAIPWLRDREAYLRGIRGDERHLKDLSPDRQSRSDHQGGRGVAHEHHTDGCGRRD